MTCCISAIANDTETAKFMFLLCWGRWLSTSPFTKLLSANPNLCCSLGTISSSNLDYAIWISKSAKQFYSLATTRVCKQLLFGTQQQACVWMIAIPPGSGTWPMTFLKLLKHENINNDPVLNARHPRMETILRSLKYLLLITNTYTLSTTIKKHLSLHNLSQK